jgi:multidrug transporter EmrE-like cation transporter
MNTAVATVVNNPVGLILVAAFFGVCGQLTLKMGMTQVGRLGADALAEPVQVLVRVATSPLVVGGLALYVAGAGVWMMVLSRSALSFAYPILAIGYAITPVLAWVLLGESVNTIRWLGIAFICLGVVVVSRS